MTRVARCRSVILLYPYAGQAHYDCVRKDPRRVAERDTGAYEQQRRRKRYQEYAPSHKTTSFHGDKALPVY